MFFAGRPAILSRGGRFSGLSWLAASVMVMAVAATRSVVAVPGCVVDSRRLLFADPSSATVGFGIYNTNVQSEIVPDMHGLCTILWDNKTDRWLHSMLLNP